MKTLLLSLFFLSVLAGCPEKTMTPDPVPVDEPKAAPVAKPQAWLSYDDLMGFGGRLAPHAGPNLYVPMILLANGALVDVSNAAS